MNYPNKKKISPISEAYQELHDFRSLKSTQELYSEVNLQVKRYKAIFLTFGLFFLFGAIYILFKTPVYFLNFVKPTVALLSLLMGVLSFILAFNTTLQKEATKLLYGRALLKLKSIRAYHLAQLPPYGFFELWKERTALRNYYEKVFHTLRHDEIETLHLIGRIHNALHLTFEAKEKLYNQALMELDDNFEKALKDYRDMKIPFLDK
jgi:hypothetical protein